ncbi:MAG: hypothetical protein R6U95_01415 [Bacteroidales bacterium]
MKKVLIITYYWPPAGGIGVHRCLKFAKYLREFGWEPIIYTADGADYAYKDETNFKDIQEGITVLRKKIVEPFRLFKFFSGRKKDDPSNPVYVRSKKGGFIDVFSIWLRGNFFIPDAKCLWIRPSVRYLSTYLRENKVDAILTDGPPHTNTVIGCKLSQKFNIPWLADFQDPWTQVDYYKMFHILPWADKKHKRMEQEVFATAKKITIASPTWGKDLERIGAKHVSPVFWGFDEDDFRSNSPELDTDFTITHAGLLGFDRKPDTLFRVLKDLKNELPEFGQMLKLNFAGVVDFSVKDELKENGLLENFVEFGNIPRPQALELTRKAQILFLPLNIADNAKGRIPGKLFEILRAHRPVLCLGPKESDVETIITKTNSGECIEYSDYDALKAFILEHYNAYMKGENVIHQKDISTYSVRNQVKKIGGYLDLISTSEKK